MSENQSIQAIQEIILEGVESVWLALNNLLGLDHDQSYSIIKPYLDLALDNPLYMASAALLIFGFPYAMYKIRKINLEAEQRYDKIINRMNPDDSFDSEEELKSGHHFDDDEDDTERPLFPGSKTDYTDDEDSAMDVFNELEESDEEDSMDDLQHIADSMETEDSARQETSEASMDHILKMTKTSDKNTEGEGQTNSEEEELDPILKSLLDASQDDDTLSHFSEPSSESDDLDDLQDQAILDLQAEMEDSINTLQNQINQNGTEKNYSRIEETDESDLDSADATRNEANPELESILNEKFDWDNPFPETDEDDLEELDDPDSTAQAEEIRKLQKEMEDSINEITGHIAAPLDYKSISLPEASLDEPDEELVASPEITDRELEEIAEEIYHTGVSPKPEVRTEKLPDNYSLEEELTLPEDLAEFKQTARQDVSAQQKPETTVSLPSDSNLEDEMTLADFASLASQEVEEEEPEAEILSTEPIHQEENNIDSLEQVFEADADAEAEPEPEPEPVSKITGAVFSSEETPQESLTTEEPAISEPVLKTVVDQTVSRKVDRLVDRLTQFQERIDTIKNLDPGTQKALNTTNFLQGLNYQKAELKSQNVKPALSDKEYIDLLESFIFLEDQNKK